MKIPVDNDKLYYIKIKISFYLLSVFFHVKNQMELLQSHSNLIVQLPFLSFYFLFFNL